ncbi:MAG: N-acetylglucosamine-6-phosphate deacetylase [Eggerthellaceae bacterium]|nr:N-acetylglucosamine-6-phosphate deacetylase [Eggerthellaceae bacterium]
MTLPEEQLLKAAISAKEYVPAEDEADFLGINMEGPFISPSKVGAQNPEYVCGATVEEFERLQEASGGLFKLVDIAPEEPGAIEFIDALKDDVRISVAHTCTDYDTATEAFDHGAKEITHLYNAMNPMHHRNPGPIPAALEHDEVTAEIITDGIHIHPAMVRLAFRMFGDDRMILISDTLRAAGLDDGKYDLGGQEVTVHGPEARIANGALAGSVSDLMRCFYVAVNDMQIPLVSALKAATQNPAKALGVEEKYGTLYPGAKADAVLLDKETLELKKVILRGHEIEITPNRTFKKE